MEKTTNFDPRIHGGTARSTEELPHFEPLQSTSTTAPIGEPGAKDVFNSVAGTGTLSQGIGAARQTELQRPDATYGQSAKAAWAESSIPTVLEYINADSYVPAADYSVVHQMAMLKFTPTEAESKLLSKSVSPEHFQAKLDRIEVQRANNLLMSDNPKLAFAIAVADPGYLMLDVLGAGVGRVASVAGLSARASRMTAAGIGGAGAYALGKAQQQMKAMDESEIVLNAVAQFGATALAWRPRAGKELDPTDAGEFANKIPDLPEGELSDSLSKARAARPEPEVVVVRAEGETMQVDVTQRRAEHAALLTRELRKAGVNDAELESRLTTLANNPTVGGDGPILEALRRLAPSEATEATQAQRALAQRLQIMGAPSRESLDIVRRTEPAPYKDFAARPATDVLDNLVLAGNEWSALAKEIQGVGRGVLGNLNVRVVPEDVLTTNKTRSHYNPRLHEVVVTSLEPRVLTHEIMHGITAHKIGYGLQNPKTAHGAIVEKLEALRAEARSHLELRGLDKTSEYLTNDLFEFTAGLFWGKSKFTAVLASIPGRGLAILDGFVQGVRQLLGLAPDKTSMLTDAIGLTEELVRLPLDVKVNNAQRGFTMHFEPPANMQAPAASIAKSQDGWAKKVGNAIAWNAHKTMSGMGAMGKRVADLLVDNPVDMRGDSAVSQRRAIRADLSAHQYRYEEALKEAMAEQGAGWLRRQTAPTEALATQKRIERMVAEELLRRDREVRTGVATVSPHTDAVQRMADNAGEAFGAGLGEMRAAGVMGAENFQANRGYFPRKWAVTNIEDMERALQATGLTAAQASRRLTEAVASGMRRATPGMDIEVSEDIASATLSRARAKGYFEDAAFRRHIGNESAKEVREILSGSGISPERMQRALDAITGQVDEAGKMSSMKHRMDVDMDVGVHFPDGSIRPLADLIETDMLRLMDGYLDDAAGQAALARKGLVSASDIDRLRTEFLHSIDNMGDRKKAADLFDNFIADLKGNPTGEDMHEYMRHMQAMTQMVALGASGLWQVTETAVIAQRYGMLKTVKHALTTMPAFRGLLEETLTDATRATHLSEILRRNSSQDVRIRPYIQKMEDNFMLDNTDRMGLVLSQAKQAVPMINAMKYIQRWQARMTANLVTDVFRKAATGDVDALAALNKYGLESHTMDSIKADIAAGGMDTSAWTQTTWEQVRGPLTKMMDEAVLHNRTGEIPAFAQFSQVGKFLFSFRSFTLGAHNKVLSGTLARDGAAGLSLLLLYQYPLTFLATAANTGISGKDKTTEQIAAGSLSQMGAVGLFGELFGVATGQKQQFGAPGLIALDRVYRVGAGIAAGDPGATGAALLQATPLLAILPPTKAIAETLKD